MYLVRDHPQRLSRARVAYDYTTTWVDDRYILPTPASAGKPLQIQIPTSRRKMQAMKIRLTVVGAATQATASTVPGIVIDLPLLPATSWTATIGADGAG